MWILEGGYCSDTRYESKYQQKVQQHQGITNLLTQYGYDVLSRPLLLDFAGTIYKSNVTAFNRPWDQSTPSTQSPPQAAHTCNTLPAKHYNRRRRLERIGR